VGEDEMPYAQSELSDLKAALNPLARTMAASLGGPEQTKS